MALIIDTYNESNQNTIQVLNNAAFGACQSFTGDGNTIHQTQFYLSKGGSPTGNMESNIYAHTGTFGSFSKPTGSPLATSTAIDVSVLTAGLALIIFTFPSPFTTVNTTKYCVTIEYDDGTASNTVQVGIDTTSSTHGGNFALENPQDTWAGFSTIDTIFYVETLLLDTVSDRFSMLGF